MHHTAHEPQRFGNIVPIPANIFLRGSDVRRREFLDASALRKDIRRMAQLRYLRDDCRFQVKNIFLSEQVEPSPAPAELLYPFQN